MTPAVVERYHLALPLRIWGWLNQRQISDEIITRAKLGWSGSALSIPIFDANGRFVFFKFRKDPDNQVLELSKYWSQPGAHAELYGWEHLQARQALVVICEGELDRLCLESHGIPVITSTAGAGVFKPEWARACEAIAEVYICFDNDPAGRQGAERVARLIPHARIITLPTEVGPGGDVTDFFVKLNKHTEDFFALLADAMPLSPPVITQSVVKLSRPRLQSDSEVATLKASVSIEAIIRQYIPLHRSGRVLIGRCCLHDDRVPSLVVYPDTQSFYCFGCGIGGDVIRFLMEAEGLGFREALEILVRDNNSWTRPSHKASQP